MKKTVLIQSIEDLAAEIRRVGILPFFANGVRGWSVEEHIDPSVWFTDREGPWEWKGRLASEKKCVYGKFIQNKAAFIDPQWFPDLANWRREGCDWEDRVDGGLAPYRDRLLMQYLNHHPFVLLKYAKRECGFSKGFDTVVTRLQMQTYVIIPDFQYSLTKDGVPYGWGNAVIDLADRWLGADELRTPDNRTPEASFDRMIRHLTRELPDADELLLRKTLK